MYVKLDPVLEAMNLEVGTPEVITEGMMWLEPIDNIFTKHSCDHADPDADPESYDYSHRPWARLLDEKRDDYDYETTRDSIRHWGFIRPVTVQAINKGRDYKYGDGHHRLAAAIDEGFTHIPVQAYEGYYEIARDSGSWDGTREGALQGRRIRDYA